MQCYETLTLLIGAQREVFFLQLDSASQPRPMAKYAAREELAGDPRTASNWSDKSPPIIRDPDSPITGRSRAGSDASSHLTVADRGYEEYANAYPPGSVIPPLKVPSLPGGYSTTLKSKLLQLRCRPTQSATQFFFPRGSIEELIDENVVRVAIIWGRLYIEPAAAGEWAAEVCKAHVCQGKACSYLKVFATLVMIGHDSDIVDFVLDKLCDSQLPLAKVNIDGIIGNLVHLRRKTDQDTPPRCVQSWDFDVHENFYRMQWAMLAPFFSKTGVLYYQLVENDIRPWVEEDSSNSQYGGYSEVTRVKIHPRHHNFEQTNVCYNLDLISGK